MDLEGSAGTMLAWRLPLYSVKNRPENGGDHEYMAPAPHSKGEAMNAARHSISEPRELGRLLLTYWRRWLVTALLIASAAATYALTASKSWQSSQALIVRNEAVGNDAETAKFHGPDELKGIQETIVELSKGRGMLRAALAQLGPPDNRLRPSAWPADADVESLQRAVKIVPPKGVELGASELFYLEVRDKDRQRALDLSGAVCRQLQRHLQEIRDAKAQSMIDELQKAVQLAQHDLQAATARLIALEREVGSDLPELRSLLDSNSSDTSLRRTVSEIESELRQYRASEEADRQLLKLLRDALADPTRLMAAPNRLLDSQPALRRLKEGLVDAQLRTAALQGRMSAAHPEVIAAHEAETQVAERLHTELTTAIRGVESELAVAVGRLELLQQQRQRAAARLDRLAGLRATYANVLSETSNRAKLLERSEQSLSNARSSSASAKAASLITPVDSPDTGANPVSPAAWIVVLGGLLGGLLTGVGVVLLTAPTSTEAASSSMSIVATEAVGAVAEAREFAAPAQYGLTCAQALKLLNQRDKVGNTRF
jgi:polysaccharide biosynthesis transport protein